MARNLSSPTALLMRALAGGQSGLLSFGDAQLFVKVGRIVQVKGLRLLDRWKDTLGDEADDLNAAVLTVVQDGAALQEVWDTAAQALGLVLARTSAGRVDGKWEAGIAAPAGAFPLEANLGKAIRDGYSVERPADTVAQRLGKSMDEPLSVAPLDPADRGLLSTGTMRTLKRCRKARTLAALLQEVAPEGPRVIERTWLDLDLLFELGVLELGKTAVEGKKRNRTLDERKVRSLLRRADKFEAMKPLTALGFKPKADLKVDAEILGSQFRKVAAPYHPDQFTEEGREVKQAAAHVFAVLNQHRDDMVKEARLLSAEVERLQAEGRGEVFVPKKLRDRARVLFRAATGLEDMRRWKECVEKLDEAIGFDPNEPMYKVVRLFVGVVLKEMTGSEAVRQMDLLTIEGLGAKIELHYRVGRLLRMDGNKKKALARFEQVLELNERHVGAAREVRLLRSRSK
ncbi:MAG: hypothetical protein GY913_14290 [Proteobacteria bacterium]|nr:hypothetical protein [Pseudomonadota bacterium]MCP4918078.1 hypothetical protein [Pseudomonadota bacterium]